jgi:hypothetical protein
MNKIFNSVKLDYYILKSADLRRLAIVGLVPLLVGGLSKNPPLILGMSMLIGGFFMSTTFAVIEKNNLNKLYGILPVKKQETVIGRYVFTLICGIAIAVLASIFAFAASLIFQIGLDGFTYTVWLCGSLLLFCLIISIQFPLYFKYDFSKLVAFANLPYILILLAGSYLIKKYPQLFGQTVTFFTQNPYMIWVLGIVGGLALLAISTFISIELYKTREL